LKKIPVKYSLILCLIMFAIFYGCGIKSNPVSFKSVSDDALIIRNLKAAIDGDAVILQWHFNGGDLKDHDIAIEKSEAGGAGNECPNCPKTFERVGRIAVKALKQENEGYYRYIDKEVIKGKTYYYRLLLCEGFNNCSEKAVTKINFE
jgi:hypothetical protein